MARSMGTSLVAVMVFIISMSNVQCRREEKSTTTVSPAPMPNPEIWSVERDVNDAVRVHMAKLHRTIKDELIDCEVRAIIPMSYRSSESFFLVRAEIEFEDDYHDQYLHVKYEVDGDTTKLIAMDNKVEKDSKLRNFNRNRIETCEDDYWPWSHKG